MKESSQKDELISELGSRPLDPITEERIAEVRILNEKYQNHIIMTGMADV